MDTWGGFWRGGCEERQKKEKRKKESELQFGSKHGLLYGIIVSRSRTLFLLLRRLSGKVRLSGLRTTGSDGGRGGRDGGGRRTAWADWLWLKRWQGCRKERRITRGGSLQFGKTRAYCEGQRSQQEWNQRLPSRGSEGQKGAPCWQRKTYSGPLTITERRRVEQRWSTNRVIINSCFLTALVSFSFSTFLASLAYDTNTP